MMRLSVDEILEVVSGELLRGSGDTGFTRLVTDSREEDMDSALFIPLKGDRFDAHDFLEDVVNKKPAVIFTENILDFSVPEETVVVRVVSTLTALQYLANYYRRKCGFKVIGVTGTNGKTTVKEFLKTVLSSKYSVYASEGSLNNHWGVPFTLLNADSGTEIVVCEMGMNSPGEIAKLVEIAEPDICGVTFVGKGHLEGMGTIENVSIEKESIYKAAKEEAAFVFNEDNKFTKEMIPRYLNHSQINFGTRDSRVWIQVDSVQIDGLVISGKIDDYEFEGVEIPIFGKHNAINLMMTASYALHLEFSPQEIIKSMMNLKMAWGRNQILHQENLTFVLDAYNANPESMSAFIENASEIELSGSKHLILGEMLELGETAKEEHVQIAKMIGNDSFKSVHFFGSNFKHFQAALKNNGFKESGVFSATYEQVLARNIQPMIEPGDTLFVKASRGIRLERILDDLI
ncbi:MAG: UDP-N-acetylmuramoyl-tripeptide--D-alanyl-D-alanine ligase [Bdellovibrionales bacterium]